MTTPDTSRVDVASWQEGIEAAALADQIEKRARDVAAPPFDDLIEENWKVIVSALRALTPPERAASPSGESERCPACGFFAETCGNGADCPVSPPPEAASPSGKNGWRLVPVEPTEEMIQAAWDKVPGGAAKPTWVVMLAAAPPAPDVPAQAGYSDDDYHRLHKVYCAASARATVAEARIRDLEAEAAASRAEVERWKATLDVVLSETAKELGCEPDNEAILAAASASRAEVERLTLADADHDEGFRLLRDALAAARADVDLLTKERDTEIAARTEQEARYGDLRFENAVLARQADALAGALGEARRGMDMVHNGLMDPTRPRQSVGEVACHWLRKIDAALAAHRAGSATMDEVK